MGTCVSRCLQPWLESPNSHKRARVHLVSIERQVSIEGDSLLQDDDDDEDVPLEQLMWTRTTEHDARDPRQKQLRERQTEMNGDKGRQLVREEENMRLEEEAYYEAKKAGDSAAELVKEREKAEQTLRDLGSSSQPVFSVAGGASLDWLTELGGDGNAGGSGSGSAQQELEDFELFLESVKKRSLSQTSFAKSQDPAASGVDLLGSGGSSQRRDDDFTLFEESVMPTATTSQ